VSNADTVDIKTHEICLAPIKLKVSRSTTNKIPTGTKPKLWPRKKDQPKTGAYDPDFDTTRKFGRRSFLIHWDHVAKGFIRRSECDLEKTEIPECIADLVGSFYEDKEAGIFQLAYRIRGKMSKARIRSLTKRLVKEASVALVRRHAVEGALDNIKDGDYYLNQLLKREYLDAFSTDMKPITSESKMNYTFTMEKGLIFDCFEFKK